jgi:ppGpp synthetase/RelA/SpoT-type nucleotidyltranferase
MTNLEKCYRERFDNVLRPIADALKMQLSELLQREPRIDKISARAKLVDRFLKKALKEEDGKPKYPEPLRQVQDQIAARVVTFYSSDVERISKVVRRYYRPIESQNIVPDSESEFGYFGQHFIFFIPSELLGKSFDKDLVPEVFELQVKTLFQHAWSEADHDLGYKPQGEPLSSDQKRRLAFTAAQAWGADHIFEELFVELSGRAKAYEENNTSVSI